MDTSYEEMFCPIIIIIITIIIIINITILLYTTNTKYLMAQLSSLSSLNHQVLPEKKIISYKKLKVVFKITGQSEYGRKLQSMIKMFFQQKIPEKKKPPG